MGTCLHCKKILEGRSDKKFCDSLCRGIYHYEKVKVEPSSFYFKVQQQLKNNRKILRKFNPGGKATVREELLLDEGFDPSFFTHYWKNSKGKVYFFVYEFGFLKISENSRVKFSLIQWQDYMF